MKFPKLVIEEAKNLRKFASKKELSKLDFDSLMPERSDRCIYGQMTGSCWSERTSELIQKCAKRVYSDKSEGLCQGVFYKAVLNGSPIGKERFSYWSPIEVFISRNQRDNKISANRKLINFLKGEIKSL